MTPVTKMLLTTLDYGFDRASWHGPNLMGSLRGVRFDQALKRLPGRKSVWDQALHAAYWKQMVLNKVIGTTPFPRKGSNWPAPGPTATPTSGAWASDAKAWAPDAKAWAADVQLLRDLHQRLRAGVQRLPPSRLDEKLTRMIIGAAFHDIYHAGQIRLIRKMLKGEAPAAYA